MAKINLREIFILLPGFLLIMGCGKNETHYFADTENAGLGIFSNTTNNLLSCYIKDEPWRTTNRIIYPVNYQSHFEVHITKQPGNLQDTLLITWQGYYPQKDSIDGYLSLHLAVPPNFTHNNFYVLQGQRLHIDLNNGYFSANINGLDNGAVKGSGDIYFNTAQLDSIAPNGYTGEMAGLFEVDFISFKITKGRFDHLLEPGQVEF